MILRSGLKFVENFAAVLPQIPYLHSISQIGESLTNLESEAIENVLQIENLENLKLKVNCSNFVWCQQRSLSPRGLLVNTLAIC